MIIPMRCFTCGKEIADLWPIYCEVKERCKDDNLTETQTHDELNKALKLKRFCCKRMLITHVEIIDQLIKYSSNKV